MEYKADILLIDDEPEIRNLISSSLEGRGYRVSGAVSGEEGLEKAKTGRFDIALLDIRLPGIDGIQTLERIRNLNPEMEVIMITAYSSLSSAIETLKKGAADYVEKPIIVEKLISSIEKVLEQRRLKETVLLYEVSKVVFTTIELDILLKRIVDLTMRLLRADDVSVMLFDEERRLYIAISSGLSEDVRKKTRLSIGERIAGWVAKNKEPLVLINGLSKDSRFRGIAGRDEVRSAMVIPLLKGNDIVGILNANRINVIENFTRNDLYKVKIFIPLVSLALDNARLFDKLKLAQNRIIENNERFASSEKAALEKIEELKKAHDKLAAAQKQLVQAERLSSLGKLVAEMAHEVSNPLMVISGNAQLCLMEGVETKGMKLSLENIVEEAKAAKEIIQRVLRFSRPSAGERKKTDVNGSIESVVGLIERQFKLSDIRIVRNYAPALPPISMDERQIQEVYLNLLHNARDSMPRGGSIEIFTIMENGHLRIDFKDTGCGLSEEARRRLFEPFFTTKEKGTGLGLSVCHGIIKEHKGSLILESGPQMGTTATILLPIERDMNDISDTQK